MPKYNQFSLMQNIFNLATKITQKILFLKSLNCKKCPNLLTVMSKIIEMLFFFAVDLNINNEYD